MAGSSRRAERSWLGLAGGVRGVRRRVHPTAQARAGSHDNIKPNFVPWDSASCGCDHQFVVFPLCGPSKLSSRARTQTLRLAQHVLFCQPSCRMADSMTRCTSSAPAAGGKPLRV